MRFGWHHDKSERNQRERGFGFEVAALIFAGPTVEVEDTRHDYGETRVRALGMVEGRLLSVIYTDRGDVRHIISARSASRKERMLWPSGS